MNDEANDESNFDFENEFDLFDGVMSPEKKSNIEFTGENLKDFSDERGTEFIDALAKRRLDDDELKIFNINQKIIKARNFHAVVLDKATKEIIANNLEGLKKEYNNLLSSIIEKSRGATEDIRQSLGSANNTDLDKKIAEIKRLQGEILDVVKKAENLLIDSDSAQLKIAKNIYGQVEKSFKKNLDEHLEEFLDREQDKRNKKILDGFKYLFVIAGVSLFLMGMSLKHLF
ncbi:hypothetical protein [Herbaspirillum sp. ST 5-3]|uniref:hypothetical protein n=1 Tax=Oxalobacteraceae TaxID=75682 RepID=UPI0010A2DD99|nr:hypothetical protein [Herbaspirillum sp. ST 5-3]